MHSLQASSTSTGEVLSLLSRPQAIDSMARQPLNSTPTKGVGSESIAIQEFEFPYDPSMMFGMKWMPPNSVLPKALAPAEARA